MLLQKIVYKGSVFMPVKKVENGYKWGNSGKVYKTEKEAIKQAQAIYANGYKERGKK